MHNDYIILKLNILNDDENIKYYNFQSLLFGDKNLEDFLSKKLQSVFKEDRKNFYMLISKDAKTSVNAIINLIINNSQNKELASNINISNYFLNTGDEYILLNLFLNSLSKKLSSSSFINSLGECNYFIEELKDDKKIRFLKFSVNQKYLLLNNIITYMEAKYYLDNNKNGDKLDDEKSKEQKYFFISENTKDHFIKPIFPKKRKFGKRK